MVGLGGQWGALGTSMVRKRSLSRLGGDECGELLRSRGWVPGVTLAVEQEQWEWGEAVGVVQWVDAGDAGAGLGVEGAVGWAPPAGGDGVSDGHALLESRRAGDADGGTQAITQAGGDDGRREAAHGETGDGEARVVNAGQRCEPIEERGGFVAGLLYVGAELVGQAVAEAFDERGTGGAL